MPATALKTGDAWSTACRMSSSVCGLPAIRSSRGELSLALHRELCQRVVDDVLRGVHQLIPRPAVPFAEVEGVESRGEMAVVARLVDGAGSGGESVEVDVSRVLA